MPAKSSLNWKPQVRRTHASHQAILFNEGYRTEIFPEDAPTTRDYRTDRVRLFVDSNNKIATTPHTG